MTRVYEYDVFISYRRIGTDLPAWIRTHFYPRLLELLDNNLDRDVQIFFDELVPGGTEWPTALRAALQRTRVLLPVCSPKYFKDEWCLAEWHSMAERERLVSVTSRGSPGLIYPVIFSDSDSFPQYARSRRMRDFNTLNSPYPQFERTERYLAFHSAVEQVAVDLVQLFKQVPEWRPEWPVLTPAPDPPRPTRLPRL